MKIFFIHFIEADVAIEMEDEIISKNKYMPLHNVYHLISM